MGLVRHSLAAVVALLGLPLGALGALVRPAWREGWRERLGVAASALRDASPVWVHAASVGEVQAALRLIDPLAEAGTALLLSTTSATGRALAGSTRPELPVRLAPLDHPWATAAALARVRPSMLVLVETELWPSWIATAARRGIPVLVVSGRLSDRSFPRYQRLARWIAPTLARITAVGARSRLDAERFVALGVRADRVEVTGDLKLEPPSREVPLAPDLAAVLGQVPFWVAGSTHPGEEIAALEATRAARACCGPLALVVAPRHPDRREPARQALEAAGATVVRRTALPRRPLGDGEVLLLDSLGELAAVYAPARAAFVGGTLVPVGGHNLLEPVQVGCPVLFGPHVQNLRSTAGLLEETGAGRRVRDASELGTALVAILSALEQARAAAAQGRERLAAHRGATARTLALIERHRGAREAVA